MLVRPRLRMYRIGRHGDDFLTVRALSVEFLRREKEEEEYQRQLDMLGGVWSFGSGFAGQLGHGDLESSAEPRLIKKLRGRSIVHVFAVRPAHSVRMMEPAFSTCYCS